MLLVRKHPVIPAVVTCSGETIPLALVTQVYNDVMTDNWFDLATNVVPLLKDGYADIEGHLRLLEDLEPRNGPRRIQKLTAAHADEFKGSVSMRSTGNSMAPIAAVPPDSYLGVDSNGQTRVAHPSGAGLGIAADRDVVQGRPVGQLAADARPQEAAHSLVRVPERLDRSSR